MAEEPPSDLNEAIEKSRLEIAELQKRIQDMAAWRKKTDDDLERAGKSIEPNPADLPNNLEELRAERLAILADLDRTMHSGPTADHLRARLLRLDVKIHELTRKSHEAPPGAP